MRKLFATTFITLDGIMQAPGGPEEDTANGFELGGWSVSYWDDTLNDVMGNTMGKPFDLVLGRKTYDIFAAFWPNASEEEGAKPLNDARKYVASRSKPSLTWANSELIEGDVAEGIAKLKNGEGPELQVHGSGDLIQTLLKHNLIDEMQVLTFPVLAGRGKRLFGDGIVPAGLKLTSHKVSATGVIVARYEPTGAVVTGTFGA